MEDKRIIRMYQFDRFIVLMFVVLMWLTLTFVFFQVANLSSDNAVRVLAFISGAAAGAFGTAALVAVLVHLKKNFEVLYTEDIFYLDMAKSTRKD